MVMRILLELNRKHGITMVIVTHDVHLRGFADRILHLRDGKVLISPPPWWTPNFSLIVGLDEVWVRCVALLWSVRR